MKPGRYLCVAGLFVTVLTVGFWPGSLPVWADDTDKKTFKERKHESADSLRERAKENARAGLGYGNVYAPDLNRDIDFYAIGRQIERLGAIIQQLADPAGARQMESFIPRPPSGWPGLGGAGTLSGTSVSPEVARIYGLDGPTEKSVRLILEYRLMVAGNPRLAVGEVKDEDNRIIAHVVTVDGSLVEEYAIDKKTGVWVPIR